MKRWLNSDEKAHLTNCKKSKIILSPSYCCNKPQKSESQQYTAKNNSKIHLKPTPFKTKTRYEHVSWISSGPSPRLKCNSFTSWKRIFTHSNLNKPYYDEICHGSYLVCSLLKLLTCQGTGMASIVRPHLTDVRTIGNRWAFHCIFVQIAK